MNNKQLLLNIKWLGHAGFLINEKAGIYIDPYKLGFPDIGDMVLVTHEHDRHCDPSEIKWLRKGSTVIVVPTQCAGKFQGDIRIVKAGDVITVKGINIEVMPAYTISNPRHAKESGGLGYIITMSDGLRVYHTGDTGLIPEMKEGIADVVLLPIGGENTMDAAQAAAAVDLMKPKVAVPMHWVPGKEGQAEAERFRSLCETEVEFLKLIR
jgi:L-ascorbate metabolism protein UlaG (beta-lactamase superfamily)